MKADQIQEFIEMQNPASPVYWQVAESLRKRILSGELRPGTRFPPEPELASALGINRLTLRRSLQILTEQRLITQLPRRGTFVSFARTKGLRIGVVFPTNSFLELGSYFQQLLAGINYGMFGKENSELVFINSAGIKSSKSIETINRARCDGLIVAINHRLLAKILCQKAYDHIPMIFVNSFEPCVEAADRYIVRLAKGSIQTGVKHLLALGHTRIAYISLHIPFLRMLLQRNDEFLNCRLKDGINAIGKAGEDWFDYSRKTACDLCKSKNPPTAIVCPGIIFASGAWQGVMDAGLRIPEDVSLVGFDPVENTNPYMTAVEQPIGIMMKKAVDLIYDMKSAGKPLKEQIYSFPAELQERGSCKPLETGDRKKPAAEDNFKQDKTSHCKQQTGGD
ncbi:MAG: Arabinose metabolism transcriptional repressor [Lentisphaerae bacterium ADurb.Bin242]|nr:MAG: Arabinose metabolism transcriptional repressor [Lentisphaerae bacterium ADurb.Bin242]